MSEAAPILHLHIGRNKVGSTTLQTYFANHVPYLRQNGIDYVFFGQPSPSGSNLPSFSSHHDIMAFARARQDRSVLVSNEGLCCFPPDFTRVIAADLARLDTRVIFYIRPYRDWVVSSYNFEVRTGHNGDGFDDYLARIKDTVSFWPNLEVWGQELGWGKIRVRSLHPADLHGHDLVSDCLAGLGLSGAPPAPERANVSPSWWAIEVLRMIQQHGPAHGWSTADLAVAHILHHLTDQAAERASLHCPAIQYLTRAQASSLAALYNHDLAALAARTSTHLQPDHPGDLGERPFLPGVEHIPKDIMRSIREGAVEAESARLHPEAAAFVASPFFRSICDSSE